MIALRELKEARLRMQMLRRCNLLTAEHDPVINETAELVKTVANIIHNSSAADSKGGFLEPVTKPD